VCDNYQTATCFDTGVLPSGNLFLEEGIRVSTR